MRGIGVSPGAAVGPAYVVNGGPSRRRDAGTPTEERQAFDEALEQSVGELKALEERLRADGLEDEAGIMGAQAMMVQDPTLIEQVAAAINQGSPATDAVQATAESFKAMFASLDDPYLAARALDVQDVADRVCRRLTGEETIIQVAQPSIVVAPDLTPSQTASLDRAMVLGFATEGGSSTAHTAILAQALGIPAVVGVEGLMDAISSGQEMALSGTSGRIVIDPTQKEREQFALVATERELTTTRLRTLRDRPAETRDGRRIKLAANIGSPDDLPAALEAGAEGIGLFRSEFLFAQREAPPTEDEQVEAYGAALEAMPDHLVVVRTLDVGGDKPLPYLPHDDEANPFLGVRGVRYTLHHESLFRSQLRALLRASHRGRLGIMFPMVAGLEEIQRAMSLLEDEQGRVGGQADLGIMIELPSAALLAGRLARQLSFLSVGSNDLVQYTMGADRGNPRVASLYQPLNPAVLELMGRTVAGAHAASGWAGVCGEMAGDVQAIPILIGLGFDELSMTPSRIPEAKERVRGLNAADCRALARSALQCTTADEVVELIGTLDEQPR